MEYTKRTAILWAAWLAIVPLGLFIVYQIAPPNNISIGYLITFLAFAVITTLFPLTINGHSIFVVQWMMLAVFLKYGIFLEMLMMQFSALVVILRTRSTESYAVRIPFNSIMFFISSLFAGMTFLIYGGQVGATSLEHVLLFGLLYQFVYFFANHVFLYTYDRLLGEKVRFITIDSIWDFTVMLIAFPYTIVLYLVESQVGVAGLFLLGLPFVFISFFLRLYSNSERITRDLKKAAEIGHELAGRMSTQDVIDLFMVKVVELLPLDSAYLLDYRKSSGKFVVLRYLQDGQFAELEIEPQDGREGIAGFVRKSRKPVIYRNRTEWENISSGHMVEGAESIMALPLIRSGEVEGVLILVSKKKNTFIQHQMKLIDMLSSYFAVSLEKASLVERAIDRSERCGLTGLYNFRYLNDELERNMNKLTEGKIDSLSLIMMDIDYFKSINDQYGHQSGNDILAGVARILEDEVGDEGAIARYGGEEFVILLPNYGKDLAILLAETLRVRIEKHRFTIQSDLDINRTFRRVGITMSIGISTAPEDIDDAMGLIRNADRALYIGAKQAGRNKVAAYTK